MKNWQELEADLVIEGFHLRDGLFTMRTRRNCGWRSEIGVVESVLRPEEKRVENPREKYRKGLTIRKRQGMIRGCR